MMKSVMMTEILMAMVLVVMMMMRIKCGDDRQYVGTGSHYQSLPEIWWLAENS